MALPGVRTVLKDRFYALSRRDAPEGITVAIIGRRSNVGDTTDSTGYTTPQDYDAYRAVSEDRVIQAFGAGSELHRGYLEALSGGAARIDLIPVPSDVTDADYLDTAAGNPLENAFAAIEVAQSDIVVPWARGSAPSEWQNPATPADDPAEIGLVADNDVSSTASFAKRVADYCRAITDRSNPCFAVMGLTPYVDASGTDSAIAAANVATHLEYNDLIAKEEIGRAHV